VGFRARCALAWLRRGHVVRARAIRDYLAGCSEPKLHLAATKELDGFLNSQVLGDVPIDITRPLPLPDASFVLIYSSHLVEHIQRLQFLDFLRESRRVLRSGGRHIIATPSAERVARTVYGPDGPEKSALLDHGVRFYPEGFNTPGQQLNLTMRAFGHRYLYDLAYMRQAGLAAGFARVETIDNFSLPDVALAAYVRSSKSPRWSVETETFVLTAP
jgi:SAM-dependent methyltransferase